jgi:hypothetical protein
LAKKQMGLKKEKHVDTALSGRAGGIQCTGKGTSAGGKKDVMHER